MTLNGDPSKERVSDDIDWHVYERIAACFEIDNADMDVSVTPNASLIGSISGVKRQIDILVDARWEQGVSRRIIFDAKLRKRKLDVKDVESFEGMMRDVRASRGVLVCSAGATKGAIQRACRNIDIRVLTTDESMELDHAAIDQCPHCATKSPPKAGLVFWDGQLPLPIGSAWAIIFTGKCDVCRSFAFWCWDCGEKVIVPDSETHECGCERTWFVEASEDDVFFMVRVDDGVVPLDRRPLR
jgi:hypothetical protein